jgi:hypothetical protein
MEMGMFREVRVAMSAPRITPFDAVLVALAVPSAAQNPAANIEPGPGTETNAMPPVMDRGIFAQSIFNQLEGRGGTAAARSFAGMDGDGPVPIATSSGSSPRAR